MSKQATNVLQYWLKEIITTPGNLQYKLHKAHSMYGIDETEVVTTEGLATPYERLNVYSSGYVLRLLECLVADFPVLKKFAGDEVFDAFAKASLTFSPPVSYTLYDLGKNFIAFLEATRPKLDSADNATDNQMLDLPIEMAKLERARQEALRAKGTEDNSSNTSAISIEDILFDPGHLLVSTPECLRLLELKFPLKNFFKAVSVDETFDLPEPQKTYIAVSRKNYHITTEEIAEWQYLFLLSCVQPINLLNAIEATITAGCNATSATLMADLYIWLPIFHDAGFLTYCRE